VCAGDGIGPSWPWQPPGISLELDADGATPSIGDAKHTVEKAKVNTIAIAKSEIGRGHRIITPHF
jgi:hypothetical protein